VKQSLPYAFGCDICQEVCPWNRDAVRTREPAFIEQNGLYGLSLERLESLPPERYSELSKGTSLERVSHRKFMNNLGLCKS
jgi:epoxyqueuosine reductase